MTAPYQDKGWRAEAPPLQGTGLGWGLSNAQLKELHRRAAEMRRNPTEPEKRLWRHLSNGQLDGHKFRRQSVIGCFIADFLCPQKALIVEVDGDTHDEGKDRVRDDILARRGFRVVRVTNDDVMSNMDGVLQHILIVLDETPKRWNNPHPNPSPEGDGLKSGQILPSPSGEGPGVGLVRDETQRVLGFSLKGSLG
jgi:very-short-patch-repair endonuclease